MSKKYISNSGIAKLMKLIKGGINSRVANTEVTDTATANKILRLDADGKLPADITGTAEKISTDRGITISGSVTGSAKYDQNGDIELNTSFRNSTVGPGEEWAASGDKKWFKVAYLKTQHTYDDLNIVFCVERTHSSDDVGILTISGRRDMNNVGLRWLVKRGFNLNDFVLVTNIIDDDQAEYTLWSSVTPRWSYNRFVVLSEGYRNTPLSNQWTLYRSVGESNAFTMEEINPEGTTKIVSADSGKVLYADKLTTPVNVSLSGDVSGSASFNGSNDIQIKTTDKTYYYYQNENPITKTWFKVATRLCNNYGDSNDLTFMVGRVYGGPEFLAVINAVTREDSDPTLKVNYLSGDFDAINNISIIKHTDDTGNISYELWMKLSGYWQSVYLNVINDSFLGSNDKNGDYNWNFNHSMGSNTSESVYSDLPENDMIFNPTLNYSRVPSAPNISDYIDLSTLSGDFLTVFANIIDSLPNGIHIKFCVSNGDFKNIMDPIWYKLTTDGIGAADLQTIYEIEMICSSGTNLPVVINVIPNQSFQKYSCIYDKVNDTPLVSKFRLVFDGNITDNQYQTQLSELIRNDRSCYVGINDFDNPVNFTENRWFKIADMTTTKIGMNRNTKFLVTGSTAGNSDIHGILSIGVYRYYTNGSTEIDARKIVKWNYSSGIDNDRLVMCIKGDSTYTTWELWWNESANYKLTKFKIIEDTNSIGTTGDTWTLYDSQNENGIAEIPVDQYNFVVKSRTNLLSNSISGNSGSSDKLTTPRTIKITGPVLGSALFDGSSDIEIATSSKGFKVINDVMPPTNASYQLIATRTAHANSRNMLMFIISSSNSKATVSVESDTGSNPSTTTTNCTTNSINLSDQSGDDLINKFILTYKSTGDDTYEFSLWFNNYTYNKRYDITVINNYMVNGEDENWIFNEVVVASVDTDKVVSTIPSTEYIEATAKRRIQYGTSMYAYQLETARKIGLSGDVMGEVSFNGSKDVSITATIPVDSMSSETFEWKDGNSTNADRSGLFVTLDGEELVAANDSSDFILGVVTSCNGSSSKVKMSGTVTVIDDGTCVVNGYCNPTTGGIATNVDDYTSFRVLKRVDDTHVKILMTYMKYITYEEVTE